MRIGFIGAGNMATALAGAIVGAIDDARIVAFDVDAGRLANFVRAVARPGTPGSVTAAAGNSQVVDGCDVCFLAVKPQVMPTVLAEIAGASGLLVSIAAGIRISSLESALPDARIVRVMPNTPCLVGAMAAGYANGSRVTEDDRQIVSRLLASAGYAVELPESLLDAVTGLSGSGPAFVARLIGAFTDAGTANGLPRDVAYRLSIATFAGTARLLDERGMTPDELVAMVSSPNGTTVAGRAVLEASDLADVIASTVTAATDRSKELGS